MEELLCPSFLKQGKKRGFSLLSKVSVWNSSSLPPPRMFLCNSDSWKSNDLAWELPQHRILAQGSRASPSCWVRVFQLLQALLEPWGCSCSPRLVPNPGQGWDVSLIQVLNACVGVDGEHLS